MMSSTTLAVLLACMVSLASASFDTSCTSLRIDSSQTCDTACIGSFNWKARYGTAGSSSCICISSTPYDIVCTNTPTSVSSITLNSTTCEAPSDCKTKCFLGGYGVEVRGNAMRFSPRGVDGCTCEAAVGASETFNLVESGDVFTVSTSGDFVIMAFGECVFYYTASSSLALAPASLFALLVLALAKMWA